MRHRSDNNQRDIVDGLRKAGVSVFVTSNIGIGFPDLVAGLRGKTFLLEVKNPDVSLAKRALTPDEDKFHSGWRGHVRIVHSMEEALAAVGAI